MMQRHPALHCQAQDSIAIRSFLLHGIEVETAHLSERFKSFLDYVEGKREKDEMLQVLLFHGDGHFSATYVGLQEGKQQLDRNSCCFLLLLRVLQVGVAVVLVLVVVLS